MATITRMRINLEINKLLIALREHTEWESVSPEVVLRLVDGDHRELGRQFAEFIKNGGRVNVGERNAVSISRPMQFDLTTLPGREGWQIVDEETDQRSVELETLSPSMVRLETMLKTGEPSITGEERLKRIKEAGHVRLDLGVFLAFWNNQELIPENWKENADGTDCFIYFDGTVLLSPLGERYVFCMYRHNSVWNQTLDCLAVDQCQDSVSAILVPRKTA